MQQHTPWPAFYEFVTDVGGPLGWWVALQFVVLLAGTRLGLRFAWILCLMAYTNTLAKWLWAEPRPYWVSDSTVGLRASGGFGMPSGHAQGAAAFWAGLWLLFRGKALFALACVAIALTGLSRIYLGVHSTGQVLVGSALGLGLSVVLWKVLPVIERRLRAASSPRRGVIALLGLVVLGLVGWLVFQYRRDFSAPADWLERFTATQQRLDATGTMGLVEPGSVVLLALVAGYLLLAWTCAQKHHRIARTTRARVSAVICAIAVNLGSLALVRAIDESAWSAAAWLLLQPLAGLWLPLVMFGEPVPEPARADAARTEVAQ